MNGRSTWPPDCLSVDRRDGCHDGHGVSGRGVRDGLAVPRQCAGHRHVPRAGHGHPPGRGSTAAGRPGLGNARLRRGAGSCGWARCSTRCTPTSSTRWQRRSTSASSCTSPLSDSRCMRCCSRCRAWISPGSVAPWAGGLLASLPSPTPAWWPPDSASLWLGISLSYLVTEERPRADRGLRAPDRGCLRLGPRIHRAFHAAHAAIWLGHVPVQRRRVGVRLHWREWPRRPPRRKAELALLQ